MVMARAVRSLCAMRIQLIAIAILLGSQGCAADLDDEPVADDPTAATVTDHLKEIFDQVDGARITQLMREMSGVVPVVVNGQTITLGQRFNATGRRNFRNYWMQAMTNLGITEINQFHYYPDGRTRLEPHAFDPRAAFERAHPHAGMERDALLAVQLRERLRHARAELRRERQRQRLDRADLESELPARRRDLEPDEARADHAHARTGGELCAQREGVVERSEHVHPA